MGGLVVASLVAGQLMTSGNVRLAFGVIMAVLTVSTLITVLLTKELPAVAAAEAEWSLADVVRVEPRRYPAYTRLIAGRFLVLLGIYSVQAFAQYYIADRLGMAECSGGDRQPAGDDRAGADDPRVPRRLAIRPGRAGAAERVCWGPRGARAIPAGVRPVSERRSMPSVQSSAWQPASS